MSKGDLSVKMTVDVALPLLLTKGKTGRPVKRAQTGQKIPQGSTGTTTAKAG